MVKNKYHKQGQRGSYGHGVSITDRSQGSKPSRAKHSWKSRTKARNKFGKRR